MWLSLLCNHKQEEGHMDGHFRRQVCTWFNEGLQREWPTQSRASGETAWNNWQGDKVQETKEFPGRKWKTEMETMVWSASVGRGKSHRSLKRYVCRKTIPFYLLEDNGGQGSMAVFGGRSQTTRVWNCFTWIFNVHVILWVTGGYWSVLNREETKSALDLKNNSQQRLN